MLISKASAMYARGISFIELKVLSLILMLIVLCASESKMFQTSVSRTNIREGDFFNVTCAWSTPAALTALAALGDMADMADMATPACSAATNIYISLNEGPKLQTLQLNETAVYYAHNSNSSNAGINRYQCKCENRSLAETSLVIGPKLQATQFKCNSLANSQLNCSFEVSSKIFQVDETTRFNLLLLGKAINCTTAAWSSSNSSRRLECSMQNDKLDRQAHDLRAQLSISDKLGEQKENYELARAECTANSNSTCLQWNDGKLIIAQHARIHVEPSRATIRAGEAFNVTCAWESPEALRDVCSSLDNVYLSRKSQRLKTRRLNATAIYYEESSAQARHLHNSQYQCMCSKRSIGSTSFMVGYELKDVVGGFKCTFDDSLFYPTLNCSFAVPSSVFAVFEETRFSMQYALTSTNCTTALESKSSSCINCIVPSEIFASRKFADNHSIQLSMHDCLGEQQLSYTLTKAECIMLQVPELSVMNISSSSICLQWTDGQKGNHNWTNIQWYVQLSPIDTGMNYTIDPVRQFICLYALSWPHQNYSLTLERRYKHANAHEGVPRIFEFTTVATIPRRPPTVWQGGYHFSVYKPNELRVYWQQIQPFERNGPNFTYSVQAQNLNDDTQIKTEDILVEPHMAVISNMRSGQYQVTIRSQNEVGMSINFSHLSIATPAIIEKRIPKSLEMNATTLYWQAPEEQEHLKDYTIYWCAKNVDDNTRCNDAKAIETVTAKHNYYQIKLKDSLKWAVSANYYGAISSGGMVWHTLEQLTSSSYVESHSVEVVVALVVLGSCLYLLYRKLADMNEIEVDLPYGVRYNVDEQSNLIRVADHQFTTTSIPEVPNVLSANIKPLIMDHESVLNITAVKMPADKMAATPTKKTASPAEAKAEVAKTQTIPTYTTISMLAVSRPLPKPSTSCTDDTHANCDSGKYVPMQLMSSNPSSGYVMASTLYR